MKARQPDLANRHRIIQILLKSNLVVEWGMLKHQGARDK
jgi:hypothetical protein